MKDNACGIATLMFRPCFVTSVRDRSYAAGYPDASREKALIGRMSSNDASFPEIVPKSYLKSYRNPFQNVFLYFTVFDKGPVAGKLSRNSRTQVLE